ncbi:MAG: DNA repair protein RecO [Eubacterium sp.]|nr:DNA repair protein RecO [Eubacterium sp.]MBR1530940.1 DNA repair protein RecO [Eubacterium sp.]
MQQTVKGLIIREQTIGESDRLVTLLTGDLGLVRAFVRRAKTIKSQNLSSTSLFAYGEFTLYRGADAYVIDSAKPIEVFFDLRADIERLALAQYFAQLTYFLGAEETPAPETLRLVLNALHLLCKGEKDNRIIKAATEMRMLTLGGYMPDLLACYRCGTFESDPMFFDVEEGCVYCKDCYRNSAITAPLGVITALRYICLTENVAKVFSFTLSDENLDILSDISEKYLLSRIEHKLTTLEFYKSLKQ